MRRMHSSLTTVRLFRLWLPLAGAWTLLAFEGPLLQMALARLPNPTDNLAALGVAFAVLLIFESPIFSIMSAATALAADRTSYVRLRNFTFAFSASLTVLLLLMLMPPVFRVLSGEVLALPDEVAARCWWAAFYYVPAPFFVAYRRFYQGILIRFNRTSRVGIGTTIRLAGIVIALILLARLEAMEGASIATAASSFGIVIEAAVSRLMARPFVAGFFRAEAHEDGMRYAQILSFYLPLALTGVVAMAVNPLLTFFIARAPEPVASLAVYPLVQNLAFLFSCTILGLHELIISSIGEKHEHYLVLRNFAAVLLAAMLGILFVLLYTPLSAFLFETVYGLPPELAEFARGPAKLIIFLPLIFTLSFWQRAVLIHARRTAAVTWASIVELAIAGAAMLLFSILPLYSGLHAALLALIAGRGTGTLVLSLPYSRVRRPHNRS